MATRGARSGYGRRKVGYARLPFAVVLAVLTARI